MLPTRHRNAKHTYGIIEDLLQLLCGVATMATFMRVIDEHALSRIFLLLPLLLLGYLLVRKHSALRQDVHTMAMLGGAATGINSGFLSSIVTDIPQKHDLTTNPMQNEVNPDSIYLTRSLVLRHFELLHFPVIIGSVFYSCCLVFDRLPSRQNTQLAANTALVAAFLMTLTAMADSKPQANTHTEPVRVFISIFLLTFLMGMVPMIQHYQRPWMFCVVAFILNVMWQSYHFDTLVWDWVSCRYPVPGCIAGMTLIFLLNVHESGYVSDSEEEQVIDEEEAKFLASKDKPVIRNVYPKPLDVVDNREILTNAFLWHTVTYIIERISLAFIRASQKKREVNAFYEPHGSDVWISCFTMAAYLGVTSPYFRSGPLTRLGVILVGVVYYVIMTLSAGVLSNGFFLDMVFGLTVVFLCNNKF